METTKLFFNDSVVTIDLATGYLTTTFDDNTSVPAIPVVSVPTLHTAKELGYNEDLKKMTIHHEVLHTFICEKCGLEHSPTLWSVAHNHVGPGCIPLWAQYEEEALILSFQKYLNYFGEDPILKEFAEKQKVKIRKLRDEAADLLAFG